MTASMSNDQKNSFYYDGYHDARQKARYNPPESPVFAAQYRDGYEDYVFETNAYNRMSEAQLQDFIEDKRSHSQFDAEFENATRIYNIRFRPE